MRVLAVPIKSKRRPRKNISLPSGDGYLETMEIAPTVSINKGITKREHQIIGTQGQKNDTETTITVPESAKVDQQLIKEGAASKLAEIKSATPDELMGVEGIGDIPGEELRRATALKAQTEEMTNKQLKRKIFERIAEQLGILPTARGAQSFGTNEFGFESRNERLYDPSKSAEEQATDPINFVQRTYRNGRLVNIINPDFKNPSSSNSSQAQVDSTLSSAGIQPASRTERVQGSTIQVSETSSSVPINAEKAAEVAKTVAPSGSGPDHPLVGKADASTETVGKYINPGRPKGVPNRPKDDQEYKRKTSVKDDREMSEKQKIKEELEGRRKALGITDEQYEKAKREAEQYERERRNKIPLGEDVKEGFTRRRNLFDYF